MNILKVLFPKAVELEQAQKRIDELEASKAALHERYTALWQSYNSMEALAKTRSAEIDGLKSKLREQTDADLLLVSARIAANILKGKKPAASDLALQQNLVQQQRAYSQAYETAVSPYGSGNLLGALGLRGIFG